MATSEDHIVREQRPDESLIPALDGSPKLSEKQVKFLLHAIRDVNPEAADAEEEIRKRVLEIRKKAFHIYPYPCFYASYHVALAIAEHDAFTHVLETGKNSGPSNAPLLLDIGCCMGTDLRYLVHSGYPVTSLVGCDLRRDFIDLGYELYGDRDSCEIAFFAGDIFDIVPRPFPHVADDAAHGSLKLKDVRRLNELCGRVKYIWAGSIFHLFDEGTQEAVARRLVTLLDVSQGDGPAVIFGKHVAKAEEGVIDDGMGRTRYAHSPASWKKLWERVMGDKIRVRVDAAFRVNVENPIDWNPGEGTHRMLWSVWVGSMS